MMENTKLFICLIQSVWSMGDECGDYTLVLGVFDDPEKANNAGLEYLHYNFDYDEENDIYYGEFSADEVWQEIHLYNLNQGVIVEAPWNENRCIKKDDGKWYIGEEVVYG